MSTRPDLNEPSQRATDLVRDGIIDDTNTAAVRSSTTLCGSLSVAGNVSMAMALLF